MRSLLFVILAVVGSSSLRAAPTAEQIANYGAACQAVVDAVNAFRSGSGKVPLTPLEELCQAAREDAEFVSLGTGVSRDFFDRSRDAGYTGTFLTGSTAFYSRGQAAGAVLFQRLLTNLPSSGAAFLSNDAASIGIGFALRAQGGTSEYQMRIILGKAGATIGGTAGLESTNRGLIDPALLREILAGAWSGDSINGFVRDPDMIVLTDAQEKAFVAALTKFTRNETVVRVETGDLIVVKLPPQILNLIEKVTVKGQPPAGVRFDVRKGTFRGSARSPGQFTVTLMVRLKGPVKGSETLKPIRIRFLIAG
jgi:hypothetical protein